MRLKVLWWSAGVVLLVTTLLLGWKSLPRPHTFQGSLIDPPVPAADFELLDQYGHPFRLSDQKGKLVLLYFGYTNCPDECPATLAVFKQIKQKLGEQADQVRFVLITVYPERDSAPMMRQYLDKFDPAFIGLVGDRDALEPVWQAYGVYQQQELSSPEGPESQGSHMHDQPTAYPVSHSSRIYAIDRGGNLRLTYPLELGQDAILSDVRYLLGQ